MNNRTLLFLLKNQFDQSFRDWDAAQPPRTGLHASSVLESDSDFCTRQHVLAHHHEAERNVKDQFLPSLQKFVNGWALHKKWQEDLLMCTGLVKMGIDFRGVRNYELDLTHIDPETQIKYSPDVIIEFAGLMLPIEIKGINHEDYAGCKQLYERDFSQGHLYADGFTYKLVQECRPGVVGASLQEAAARNKSIRSAIPQINLYLHLLGLTTPPNNRGIILVEDKNTQDYALWVHEYDPALAEKPINNALLVRDANEHFDFNDNNLPSRICKSPNDSRAKRCPFSKACFEKRG